jgi:ATP-dependent RNA helicase RhlE
MARAALTLRPPQSTCRPSRQSRGHWRSGRVKDFQSACRPPFNLPSTSGHAGRFLPPSRYTRVFARRRGALKDSHLDNFHGFGLAAPLNTALAKLGYTRPTPIQVQAIPPLMKGHDLVGIAQTGTGKTAAFALPILNKIVNDRRPALRGGARVLVLSPTRELASQIAQSFRDLSDGLGLKISVIFGGVPHGAQIRALQAGIDVLVATPGRLLDHLDAGVARLNAVEFLVLDEVDQMLDLGFVKPIRRIVRELPKQRQNLFFSATMPTDIRALAGELLRDPVEVSVTPAAKTADRVEQSVLFVEAAKKRDLLVELFDDAELTRVLVFTRTKHGADRVTRTLDEAGINAAAIHGNKSQGQRERALAAFRGGETRVLVATDIAARGIDIDGVSHVVNFELPQVAEAYVHRIGRTARAGKAGQAISFCDHEERDLLRAIERLTRLTLFKTDRRGAAGPKPAPVVRKAAAAPVAGPSSKRPHHMPHRDPRGARPVTVETRSGHRPDFRAGAARLGREVKGRR